MAKRNSGSPFFNESMHIRSAKGIDRATLEQMRELHKVPNHRVTRELMGLWCPQVTPEGKPKVKGPSPQQQQLEALERKKEFAKVALTKETRRREKINERRERKIQELAEHLKNASQEEYRQEIAEEVRRLRSEAYHTTDKARKNALLEEADRLQFQSGVVVPTSRQRVDEMVRDKEIARELGVEEEKVSKVRREMKQEKEHNGICQGKAGNKAALEKVYAALIAERL